MIVGCDHLGIGISDITSGVDAGASLLGLHSDFRETGLLNHPSKRRYIASWQDDHNIAFLRPPGAGPALELVHHSDGRAAGSAQRTALVINGSWSGQEPQTATPPWSDESVDRVALAFDGNGAVAGALPGDLGSVIVINPDAKSSAKAGEILGAAIRIPDLQSSVDYWRDALKFRVTAIDDVHPDNWVLMSLRTPVPSWSLRIALVQSAEVDQTPGFLDALGMTSICLLSTDAEADAKLLAEFPGANMESPFQIKVSDRTLRVAVGHGPNGENIELIEIERGDRSRNA
jgi:hypothetical protein